VVLSRAENSGPSAAWSLNTGSVPGHRVDTLTSPHRARIRKHALWGDCAQSKRCQHRKYEMRQRILGFIGVAAVAAAASLVSVAGQAPTTKGQTDTVPKTSWGEPDLQGIL
jgi:hypothetical protein